METYKATPSYNTPVKKHLGANIAAGLVIGGLVVSGIIYDWLKEPTLAIQHTEGFAPNAKIIDAYLPVKGPIIEILKINEEPNDSVPLNDTTVRYSGLFNVKTLLSGRKNDKSDSIKIDQVRGSVIVQYPTIDQTVKK